MRQRGGQGRLLAVPEPYRDGTGNDTRDIHPIHRLLVDLEVVRVADLTEVAQSQPTVVMDAVDVIDVQRLEPYCNAVHFIFRTTSCGLFTQAICWW
jgi:hypothetical protein